jgi:hypothetical protein
MKKLYGLLACFFLAPLAGHAQDVGSFVKSPKKKYNIKIETMDGNTYKGRVINIEYDFIEIDPGTKMYTSTPQPFYLRPSGDYLKIDLEYLQSATMRKSRQIGISASYGAIGGGVLLGGFTYLVAKEGGAELEPFLALLAGASVGIVIGGFTGTIVGLFSRKRIPIYGSSVQLGKLRDYYL